jgi:uncharacterized MnhB-related membrane protein
MSVAARRWTVSVPCLLLAALFVTLAAPPRALAQVLYGSILGDVKLIFNTFKSEVLCSQGLPAVDLV